jgi:hypothetical protein
VVKTPTPEKANLIATALEPNIMHKNADKMPAKKENSGLLMDCLSIASKGRKGKKSLLRHSGCQKNVPVFKRFFLLPYKRLCRTSVFRNIIMESGINAKNE